MLCTQSEGASLGSRRSVAAKVASGDSRTPLLSPFGPTVPSALPVRSNHVSWVSRDLPDKYSSVPSADAEAATAGG
jgi:hypothetical protein